MMLSRLLGATVTELGRINVFYSYAHTDETYREALVEHLRELRNEGVIGEWHDRLIGPSADWRHEIESNLSRAQIVLFLLSPDFMRSTYCMGIEVRQALDLHWQKRTRIVPVLVRPTPNWTETDFGSFQALPKDAKPVSTWNRSEMAFFDIAQGIRSVCKDIVDWQNPFRRTSVGDWTEIDITQVFAGQRHTARVRNVIVAKDAEAATLALIVNSPPHAPFTVQARVPLDAPLEDKAAEMFQQFGIQPLANTHIVREETGRGEQKILVSGHPYYCRWTGAQFIYETREDRFVQTTKTWSCIDVPLDGLVREESQLRMEGFNQTFETNKVLINHGRNADVRKIRPTQATMKVITSGPDKGRCRCEYCQTLLVADQHTYMQHISVCPRRP